MPVSKSVEERVDDLCYRANDEVAKDAFEKAKKLYEEALQLGESTMDPEMRIGVREALAECYRRLKDFKQAADCNREALRLLETEWSDKYGYRHLLAVKARRDLATNLSSLSGQPDAPVDALQEAVDLRMKNIEILKTQKKPKTLADAQHKVLLDIVKLQSSQPSGANADKLFRQASSLYEELFSAWRKAGEPDDSLRFIEARHNYGVVLYELGSYAEAKKVFLENQAILDGLPEAGKKRFQLLEQNADRYLASCIEKTNDLSLGITRRCTGSLDDKQETKESKQKGTPSVKVEVQEKSSKSPSISREQSHTRKASPSIPGAFPDGETKHTATNGKLSPPRIDTPNREGSRSGSRQEDQAVDKSHEKSKVSKDQQSKHSEKESASKAETAGSTDEKKGHKTNETSDTNLKPTDDGGLKRSRSDPDKKTPSDERLTGTSFATPIAAATAALVLDLVRWQASNYPKVERCLRTYEGMSAVFQAMSGKPTKDGYYHVMPWNMLGKDKKPISPVGANESDEWYSLMEVCRWLRRFGDVSEQLD